MSRISLPKDIFQLRPGEKLKYGDFPDLRRGVDYFKSLLGKGEWEARRSAIATRFYQSLVGEIAPTDKGKYYDDSDLIGWYLFLGESLTDHPWNYEVYYGSRVVPVLAAIGHNLDILRSIDGFEERAKRLIRNQKAQPNGPLFEFLVAAAYGRAGAKVKMRPETPGQGKSYDLDVELDNKKWAVECKRLEAGEYAEDERQRMRELWKKPCIDLVHRNRSSLLLVDFKVELDAVPADYLSRKTARFVQDCKTAYLWTDGVADGEFSDLDLAPLQEALKRDFILYPSPRLTQLLTGTYERGDSMISMLRVKPASNPHYIDDIDLAVVNRWASQSENAIDKKARDITKRLSEANDQLPTDVAGVVHIGFDCLGKDDIEVRRYEKIVASARKFDRGNTKLEVIYCHYFAPDPNPDEVWAIDETVQWIGIARTGRPLETAKLLPSDKPGRPGVHWEKESSK